eukprot:3297421-Amphidinium_carterae.2
MSPTGRRGREGARERRKVLGLVPEDQRTLKIHLILISLKVEDLSEDLSVDDANCGPYIVLCFELVS